MIGVASAADETSLVSTVGEPLSLPMQVSTAAAAARLRERPRRERLRERRRARLRERPRREGLLALLALLRLREPLRETWREEDRDLPRRDDARRTPPHDQVPARHLPCRRWPAQTLSQTQRKVERAFGKIF